MVLRRLCFRIGIISVVLLVSFASTSIIITSHKLSPQSKFSGNEKIGVKDSGAYPLYGVTAWETDLSNFSLTDHIRIARKWLEGEVALGFVEYGPLLQEFNAKVAPLSNDVPAFLRYLSTHDAPSSDFQCQARRGVAQLFGFPEERIVFIDSEDLLIWILLENRIILLPEGSSMWFMGSANKLYPIAVIRNDMKGWMMLRVVVHEAIHVAQMRPQGVRRTKEPLLWNITEGLQASQIDAAIIDIARRARGALREQLIQLADELESDIPRRTGGTRESRTPSRRKLSERFARIIRGADRNEYSGQEAFVELLAERAGGVLPLKSLAYEGKIKALRDALGHNRFDALRAVLRQWVHVVPASTAPYELWEPVLLLASEMILKPREYQPASTPKLLKVVSFLHSALTQVTNELGEVPLVLWPEADRIRYVHLMTKLRMFLADLIPAYMQGEIDGAHFRKELARRLIHTISVELHWEGIQPERLPDDGLRRGA